jgi:hypothetical protein
MKTKRSRRRVRNVQNAEDGLEHLEKGMREAEEKLKLGQAALARLEEIERIGQSVEASIKDLARHAETGEPMAGAALFTIASTAVGELNGLARKQPQMFLPLSRRLFLWPAFVSHKRAITKQSQQLLELLEVGKDGVYSDGRWQFDAPTTQFVMSMHGLARNLAAAGRLPPLTAETKRKWFDESWKALLWAGVKPEEHAWVANLGKSQAKKKPMYCKTLRPATARANARAAIKNKIWQAYNAIVNAK